MVTREEIRTWFNDNQIGGAYRKMGGAVLLVLQDRADPAAFLEFPSYASADELPTKLAELKGSETGQKVMWVLELDVDLDRQLPVKLTTGTEEIKERLSDGSGFRPDRVQRFVAALAHELPSEVSVDGFIQASERALKNGYKFEPYERIQNRNDLPKIVQRMFPEGAFLEVLCDELAAIQQKTRNNDPAQ